MACWLQALLGTLVLVVAMGAFLGYIAIATKLATDYRWKKVIGIGNMCRFLLYRLNYYTNAKVNRDEKQKELKFCDNVVDYICENFKGKTVHIYGMSMTAIRRYAITS